MYCFWLKEKRLLETGRRIVIYSINMVGILFLGNLCRFIFSLKEKDKLSELVRLIGGPYDEKLQGRILMIIHMLVIVFFCTAIGLLYIYIKAVSSEICGRNKDILLLRVLGYNELRIFAYQMMYIGFDVIFAIIISTVMVRGIFMYIRKLERLAVPVNLVDSGSGVINSVIINGVILAVTVITAAFYTIKFYTIKFYTIKGKAAKF